MKILKELHQKHQNHLTRRHFLKEGTLGLGAIALGGLLGCNTVSDNNLVQSAKKLFDKNSHFAPKAKRVIFLHMAGAPSQLELFDYKPLLHQLDGKPCPDSLLKGKRFAFIRGVPEMLGPQFSFRQ